MQKTALKKIGGFYGRCLNAHIATYKLKGDFVRIHKYPIGNSVNKLIGKKVEVSLRLFDIFEKNRVFIFLWGSFGTT